MSKRKIKDRIYKEICRCMRQRGQEIHHVFGRTGLLYIDPYNCVSLTPEVHRSAHKNNVAFRLRWGWRSPDYPHSITDSDYKTLLKAYKKCKTERDLRTVFTAWIEDLR